MLCSISEAGFRAHPAHGEPGLGLVAACSRSLLYFASVYGSADYPSQLLYVHFVQFNVLVWRRVLSARQVAFLTVAAWPAALETASLAEALAATEGAPSAADVTAAGALSVRLLPAVPGFAEMPCDKTDDDWRCECRLPIHLTSNLHVVCGSSACRSWHVYRRHT